MNARTTSPLAGVLLMVTAAGLLVIHDAISKHLAETYSVGQIVALRHISSVIVILLYAGFVSGWSALRIVNKRGQAARACVFVVSTMLIILSVALLPLATATAIVFASPIFVLAFAGPLFGESVGVRRWTAVLVGFIGVLVIIRPGGAAFNWYLLVPVLAAAASGLRDNITRWLSQTEHPLAILFWSTVTVVIASSTSAYFGWKPVDLISGSWLVVLGIINTVAHFMMINALRLGDASLVTPFRYTGIVWAVLLSIAVWGEYPDLWTIAGSLIIIVSGIYIVERGERKKAGRA